jgi:hypothetical protein
MISRAVEIRTPSSGSLDMNRVSLVIAAILVIASPSSWSEADEPERVR